MSASPETRPEDSPRNVWQFAGCEFDDLRYELRAGGRLVELERKPLDVLRYLLLRPGEVVRKEELLEAAWPGVLVVDASLATAVSKLRKALGDQEVIQTIPRVGYRLAVPVTLLSRPIKTHHSFAEEPHREETAVPAPLVDPRNAWLASISKKKSLWLGLGVAAAIAASLGSIASHRRTATIKPPISIAILPFQNVSGDAGLDYLRAAVPDQIARTLSTAQSITLRPVSASTRFSEPGVNFREVGRALDVNRVLTGHFLTIGDRLQVTIETVDTDEDRIVWHDSFAVPSNNLLALQEQTVAIAHGQLANALGLSGFAKDADPRTTSEEAYELYMKSVALDWDPQPNRQAIELLRRAVLLDPNYAPAWGMLSLRYYSYARFGGGGPQMMAFSDAAAEKELALNPDSVDPIAEMTINRTERGDLVKAHQIALDLLRRRPDDPNLHHVLNYVLRYGGSLDEAGRECELVVLLATRVVWGSCSTTFMEIGNYKRAMEFLRKDLSSEWSKAHAIEVRLREGNTAQALLIPAPQIQHWESYKMLLACASHAPQEQIHALASKVEVDDDPEVDYFFAGHLAYCGETDAALRMLKIAIERNYCSFPAIDRDPFFDKLRGNPQFEKLRQSGMACHEAFVNNVDRSQIALARQKSGDDPRLADR